MNWSTWNEQLPFLYSLLRLFCDFWWFVLEEGDKGSENRDEREMETWDAQQVWGAGDKRKRSEERVRTMHCKRKTLSLHPLSCVLITFPVPKPSLTNTTNISLSLSLLIPKPAKPIRARGEGASRVSLPNSLQRKKGWNSTKDRQLVFVRKSRSLDWSVSL